MSENITVDGQVSTPTATITAEVNQTAAGAWRGSVKVSVTAPIDFDSDFDLNRTVAEAEAKLEGISEGEPWIYSDVVIDSYNDASGALSMEPTPIILVPTEREFEIRESAKRLLRSVGASVLAMVTEFNHVEGDTTIVVKGKGK